MPGTESAVHIREMREGDLVAAMALKDAENWNQTEADWRHLVAQDPGCCLVAEVDGAVVGTVTAAVYGRELAWVGMMLVGRQMRGRGVSKPLLAELMRRLDDCRSIMLDATPEGRPIYERMGFVQERVILRMEAGAPRGPVESGPHPDCRRMTRADLPMVAEFDRMVSGGGRGALLSFCLRSAPQHSWLVQTEGRVRGFLLGRPGSRGHYFGPLQAESLAVARTLLGHALGAEASGPVIMDVPADQRAWGEALRSAGFVEERALYRMHYRAPQRSGRSDWQFAIAGPEFG